MTNVTKKHAVKSSQFTTTAGKDPKIRSLVARVIEAAGIVPSGIKFSIKNKEVAAGTEWEKVNISIPNFFGIYKFCTSLILQSRYAELWVGEQSEEKFDAKTRAAYIEENTAKIRAVLDSDEGAEWDAHVDRIEKDKADAAEKKRLEIEGRPAKLIKQFQDKLSLIRAGKQEILAKLTKDTAHQYSWLIEGLGVAAFEEGHVARLISILENSEEMETADVEQRVLIILKLVSELKLELVRMLVRHQDWGRGGSPGSNMENIVKSKAMANHSAWLEKVEREIQWMLDRPRAEHFPVLCGW